jgi:hypothetical protein
VDMLQVAARVGRPTWEWERHRRGLIRWYPFDALLPAGTATAGSSTTLQTPWSRLVSGVSVGGPAFGCVTRREQQLQRWQNYDVELYWAAAHYLQCFMAIENFSVPGASGGKAYAGIYLHDPGNVVASGMPLASTAFPQVALFAWRDSADARGWELHTCVGDGVTAVTVTPLVGVNDPTFLGDPGSQPRLRRLEIHYIPGTVAVAIIDGVEGARTSVNLPDVNKTSLAGEGGAGIGVWSGGDAGNLAIASFMSFMAETPDYIP